MPKKTGLGKGLDALFGPTPEEEQVKEDDVLKNLKITEVEPNREQPRKNFNQEALEELADSIREYGLIQPIIVSEKEGYYSIIAGERRWRACKLAGLEEIPAIVREDDEKKNKEIALIENIQREDLNPFEKALGIKNLMQSYGLTQEEVAKKLGKSRSTIANSIRVLNLEPRVLEFAKQGKISEAHCKLLLAITDPEKQYLTAVDIIERGTTTRELEQTNKKINKKEAKNAAVAILPATLLINGICTINNIPNISDVQILCTILEKMGAKITWNNKNELTIDTRNITTTQAPLDLTSKFRASYYLIGAMLGRTGEIEVGMPGGCNLGARPIDQHIKGFELLGANVEIGKGTISAKANCLKGAHIYIDVVSVGATINVMLASVLAKGTTTIDNAAKEPHIVDVANFLNTMGADIRGAGTDVIKINGVEKLHGNATYSVVPDQIEAGTFMLAAMASKGDLLIKNCITKHLEPLTAKILEIGGNVEDNGDSIRVWYSKRPNKATIKTLPYPGFPTDLQPQMGVVLSTANGTSIINESIWESRFQYTAELNKMGAKITAQGKSAVFEGVDELFGAPVYSTDLRAGAALIVAGISANGVTEVYNLSHIDRGYENIEEKFRKIGANIQRVSE